MSDSWVDLGGGVKGTIKLFQNMVMLHIELKGITGAATCNKQQHGSEYYARRPHPPLTLGVKRLKFNFSEHGHIAYKIKGNHECSNMVANILPAAPLLTPTLGSKGQI